MRTLVERGANVVCLVRDWTPRSVLLSSELAGCVTLVRGDLLDAELAGRVLAEYETEVVFHLAAQTIVGVANRSPLSTFDSNIRGTWTLLEAARQHGGVKALVVASSDKAYGDQPVLPYTEDAPLQGRHPYDVSKSCADLITQAYGHSWGLNAAITRCGNLFGGGDLNFNRIVPGTVRSALRNETPLIRSDGTLVRDYLYVEDAAEAYVALAAALLENPMPGEAFNFSYENPLTVLEMVDTLLDVMGCRHLTPSVLGQAPNEIHSQFLSSAKARRELAWTPRFGLREGLTRTVDWYREFLK